MDWQALESKLLASSAYDASKHTLYLRFRTGEVYRKRQANRSASNQAA